MVECQAPGLGSHLWTKTSETRHELIRPILLILNRWIAQCSLFSRSVLSGSCCSEIREVMGPVERILSSLQTSLGSQQGLVEGLAITRMEAATAPRNCVSVKGLVGFLSHSFIQQIFIMLPDTVQIYRFGGHSFPFLKPGDVPLTLCGNLHTHKLYSNHAVWVGLNPSLPPWPQPIRAIPSFLSQGE